LARVSASRNRISIAAGVLLMPAWRMFFSRSSVRMSDASVVEALVDRRAHVDLHQEVDAAAQVEAEVHRQRVQAGQPARRIGDEVQRDGRRPDPPGWGRAPSG